MPAKPPAAAFSARVIRWQRRHGRHDLPWQGSTDAYRRWISEIMLQQTQVATVIPYYERFLARFPDVGALARAEEGAVLALWSGLGYYARARNLHRAAREVVGRFGGRFPATFDELVSLPGIGRSTAAAIAAFASGERRAILDGNVKRVLARHAGIGGDPGSAGVLARLWDAAEARLPARAIEPYTQGLMDLGAGVCLARAPRCALCPVARDCRARIEDRTTELPGRKRKAPARRRSAHLLIELASGQVRLEKRPSPGIWGGLWSLPEVSEAALPARAVPLEPFEHAFTHFTLAIQPWRVDSRKRPRAAASSASALTWLPLSELEGAALPAPVKRLLLRIRSAPAGA